jgi:outer membrane lipoprotein-sorting protein
MRKKFSGKWVWTAALGVVLAGGGAAFGQAAGGDVDSVLAQMDKASASFRNAQAEVVWDQYVKVVDDHEQQSGTVFFDRKGGATEMAVRIEKPDPKVVVYKNGELDFYQPKIDQESIFSAGANKSQYESFLTLGFGGSGSDLKTNWDVTYQGKEQVGGVDTVKLDLKPKQQTVANNFSHVLIWVDPARAISLKQIFYAPSGDTKTVTYSNIKYNAGKLPGDAFTIHTTSKTQVTRK